MSWITTAESQRRSRGGLLGKLFYVFHERQIYLRSDNDIQFIRLTPAIQVFGLALLLGALGWTAYATINIAFKDQLIAIKEKRMEEARLAYEARVDEVRASLDQLNDKLLLDQGVYLRKVDEVKAEYDLLVKQHERLVAFFRQGWMPLRDDALRKDAADVSGKGSFSDSPEAFSAKYAAEFATEHDVLQPLADMRSLHRELGQMQSALLGEASDYNSAKIDKANALRISLGLPPVSAETDPPKLADAAGGPFIATAFARTEPVIVDEKMAEIAKQVGIYERIKAEIAALPLVKPMSADAEITSEYGYRNDPFRRVPAMHAGVDFRGSWGSSVTATADGIVTGAGWDGAYGKRVEISHDNGVTTRYAHLSSVAVTIGQRVKRGAVVGRIGSTGRSTGPHLHYETRVNGEAIDPVRFWRTSDDLQALSTE
jgi:murein DD-endopeptidase MepM/ murein hydrolase activator NlpD